MKKLPESEILTLPIVSLKPIGAEVCAVVHPEVYRQQFYTLRQSDGESVTNFVSRFKAQAMLCAFTCPNQECTTSHSLDMVKSQLIAGPHNLSHQDKVYYLKWKC